VSGTRRRLLKRLGLALRIAERAIQFLGADGFGGADSPDGNFAAEKPLAETAMLLVRGESRKVGADRPKSIR
jgi:hypothetical protein